MSLLLLYCVLIDVNCLSAKIMLTSRLLGALESSDCLLMGLGIVRCSSLSTLPRIHYARQMCLNMKSI